MSPRRMFSSFCFMVQPCPRFRYPHLHFIEVSLPSHRFWSLSLCTSLASMCFYFSCHEILLWGNFNSEHPVFSSLIHDPESLISTVSYWYDLLSSETDYRLASWEIAHWHSCSTEWWRRLRKSLRGDHGCLSCSSFLAQELFILCLPCGKYELFIA